MTTGRFCLTHDQAEADHTRTSGCVYRSPRPAAPELDLLVAESESLGELLSPEVGQVALTLGTHVFIVMVALFSTLALVGASFALGRATTPPPDPTVYVITSTTTGELP